jgi:WD40 repeat protein
VDRLCISREPYDDIRRPHANLRAAGSWLASADAHGEVRVWDPVTGKTRHTLTGHIYAVSAMVVAPDGSWLASADYGGEVRVWDPVTGALVTSLRVAGGLFHLALAATTITAAGEYVPYFLALRRGSESEQNA